MSSLQTTGLEISQADSHNLPVECKTILSGLISDIEYVQAMEHLINKKIKVK